MTTPAEFIRILGFNHHQRHALLAAAVVEELEKLDELDVLTTRELCDRLWPETVSRGDVEITVRATRFPQSILKCRTVLDGWWRQGEPEERHGRTVRPILWMKGQRKPVAGKPARVDIRKLELRVAELERKLKDVP